MPIPEIAPNPVPLIPVIVAAVSAIPVIVSPIVAWRLGRTRSSREAATIEYLNKRLDLLERVNKVQTTLTDGPMKELLDVELQHYRSFLCAPSQLLATTQQLAEPSTQSRFDRFFLVTPSRTIRQRVFKGLFYFFFSFGVVGLFAPLALRFTEGSNVWENLAISLIGTVFYFSLALLCRRGAKPAAAHPATADAFSS